MSDKTKVVAVLATLLLIVVGKLAHSQLTYGDWTCSFTRCVKVK